MQFPAFFATSVNRRIFCIDSSFKGIRPMPSSAEVPLSDVSTIIRCEVRSPVVVMDYISLTKGFFHGSLTKHLKVKGMDVWLMSYIQTVEDVFDAFNGNVEMLLAPLHGILNDSDLDDIHAVSDSFIPVVFCIGSKSVGIGGRCKDVLDTLDYLTDKGYYKICVLDCEGSISEEVWETIADTYPSVIPFTLDGREMIPGFENMISKVNLDYDHHT